jgi:hypothetical protein
VFEINVRIKVDLHTRALPELACYDAAGKTITGRSVLEDGPSTSTTNWQTYRRVLPVLPGTASVRARIRGSGHGEVRVAGLEFRASSVDAYRTGALISQIYPKNRTGLVLESNLGIVNPELMSKEDRRDDGKWALVTVDLDKLSTMEEKGVDWRTKFEYKPNEIYWSDGAVLKSDAVRDDRSPDFGRALHFRMKIHPGPYRAILNDPGRAVAVSVDGKTWRRFAGGQEAELGVLPVRDGVLELWVDACYRDPVSVGPVYFDYVRLLPEDDPASDERLFRSAYRKPEPPKTKVELVRVPVKVEAPMFAGGANWPVRCAIPIPRGELGSADDVVVRGVTGRVGSYQSRAMARWPDGSVKWLFVDFAHDFSKSGSGQYEVAYGTAARPTAFVPVQVTQLGDGIFVDTGAIHFTIPKKRFAINGEVEIEVTEASGKVWRASELPVEMLWIEQAGPRHAVIVAETKRPESGKASAGFFHRAAIHVYADSPLIDVDYFIANVDSREQVKVRSIAMKIPRKGDGAGEIVEKDGKGKARGWASPPGSSLSVGVASFWQQYPKALRWKPGEMEIDLWAPEGGDYEWVQGVGKTHHVALWFGAPAQDASLLAHGPVMALASPERYARSGAFGLIDVAAASPVPAVEKTLAAHMSSTMVDQVGLGFENYGDHSSSGYVAGSYLWDNNEYDVPAGAMMHFARTGDVKALELGLASARHYLDVDTIHYSRKHADWAGGAHTHSHGDVGAHTADGPGMHHAGYVQGLIWYSYFTGDTTGIAGAKSIADWVLLKMKPEANIGQMERAAGHPLMTLTDTYEATGEEQYLRGAAKLVDWVEKWQHPVHGGFLAPITEQPAYYSGSGFNSGLIEAGLMKFNSWADLPEIEGMLERDARFLLTEMWRPPGGILSKGGSPRRGADARHVASHLRLFRAEYLRTRDPLFLGPVAEMVEAGFGAKSKGFGPRDTGLVFNYLPWYLGVLDGMEKDGELEVKPGRFGCAVLKNNGAAAVEGLRGSFQTRLDFRVVSTPRFPSRLGAGESVEVCGEVEAPERINLTSEYNRVSYAQWSLEFTRGGRRRWAHAWTRQELAADERR